MGYQDREDGISAEPVVSMAAPILEVRTPLPLMILSVVVRLLGVAILLVGLWVGLRVIDEAWGLYKDPGRIEPFAQAINTATNLDDIVNAALPGSADSPGTTPASSGRTELRLSYFIAWIIGPILMLVVSSIAMSAVSTGGRLALHDLVGDQVSRSVRREFSRGRRGR